MQANIVDLRYKMKDVLRALSRNEKVSIFYRGRIKGVILPEMEKSKRDAMKHPFFGMKKDEEESVEMVMERLRGARY